MFVTADTKKVHIHFVTNNIFIYFCIVCKRENNFIYKYILYYPQLHYFLTTNKKLNKFSGFILIKTI